jgi:hypothetical protein
MSAMPDPTDKPSSTEPPSPSGGDLKASRRRLLQGGLAAAPVLMTLISRPVLAQGTGLCTTPSGFVSANASTAGRGVVCTGHFPEYWIRLAGPPSQWPPGFPPSRPFDSVFAHDSLHYPGKTLLEVLQLQGGAPDDVARLIVAALLNAAAELTPVLSISAVKDIWSEYLSTGFFSPSSGAQWNHDEIIDYLRTTMPM